jgi:hypothetical protein
MAYIGFASKNSGNAIINLIVVLFFIFLVWTILSAIASVGSNNQSSQPANTATTVKDEKLDKITACIEAEDYIKQLLKAPSTAKFPVAECSVTNLVDNQYKVVSYVDSQNSFGAMLRSNWSVIFQTVNNNQQKKPIQVIFDGEIVYPVEESKAYKQQKVNQQKAAELQKEIDDQLNLLKSFSEEVNPSK